MAKITAALLKKIAPTISVSLRDEYEKWVNYYLPKYDINNERRVAAFFANLMEESGRLARLEENLNYSTKRLTQVWPRRFPTYAIAAGYAGKPQKLANYVYGDRNGNRGSHTDDGWTYRGGGWMQTTGRGNYRATGEAMGLDLVSHPELLRIPQFAVMSACVEWDRRGCNELADAGKLRATRKKINGGYNGMAHVEQFYNQLMAWLPDGFRLDNSPVSLPKTNGAFKDTVLEPESEHVPDTAHAEDAGSPAWIDEAETEVQTSEKPVSDESGVLSGENGSEQLGTAETVQQASAITNVGTDANAGSEKKIQAAASLPDTTVSSRIKTGFNKLWAGILAVMTGTFVIPDWIRDGITLDSIKMIGGFLWDARYLIGGALVIWFIVIKAESLWIRKKVIDTNTDPEKGNVVIEDVEEKSLWQKIRSVFTGKGNDLPQT